MRERRRMLFANVISRIGSPYSDKAVEAGL